MESFPVMESDGKMNISDVQDAMKTMDPSFAVSSRTVADDQDVKMMSGSSCLEPTRQQQQPASRQTPRVEILEQPASKALRFRYECEGRSAGSIPGVNSTPENKTFPTIRIVGYKGPAMVVVSCVTKDPPYRPHPHNLVGKEVCKEGVCSVQVPAEDLTVSFDKLGIQCIKRKDIEESLRVREKNMVDPFRTGFDHKNRPAGIDLNSIRLCFQVFLEGQAKGKFTVALPPVVSKPIYDKKAISDLLICKLSHCSASVAGGMEMMLFCEKVTKEDIQVRFFEERDGYIVWEGFADFQPTHVHKQVGIAFLTPSYKTQEVDYPIQAYVQLRRPSDGTVSEPLHFQLLPLGLDSPDLLRRKRRKFNNNPNAYLLKHMQAETKKEPGLSNQMPQYNFNLIKTEPNDRLSSFEGSPGPSPPFVQLQNTNASNMGSLRSINSSGRESLPMDVSLYNIPPVQNTPNQLQSVNLPQGSSLPMLLQDPLVGNTIAPEPQIHFPVGNTKSAANGVMLDATENAINISNVLGRAAQQMPEFNFTFDNVDLSSLNISDIVKESVNEEVATDINVEESGMTDSFTKLTRNTIQELCMLNNMYKPVRDDVN